MKDEGKMEMIEIVFYVLVLTLIVGISLEEKIVNISRKCETVYREYRLLHATYVYTALVKNGKSPALAKRDVIVLFDV